MSSNFFVTRYLSCRYTVYTMLINKHTFIHINNTYIHIYTHIHAYIHTYTHTHTHLYIHTYIHIAYMCYLIRRLRGLGADVEKKDAWEREGGIHVWLTSRGGQGIIEYYSSGILDDINKKRYNICLFNIF